jgi:hypothetical protein
MGKASKKSPRPARAARTGNRAAKKLVRWAIGLGIVALVAYGLFQTSGFPYTDVHLAVVDFTVLSAAEKRTALRTANGARCSCGCGMTLAQCVATDMTCPVRDRNIDRLKTIVQEARAR